MSKNKAFTLIEVLIYSAIVAGFVTFSVLSTYQIIDFSGRLKDQRELSENERFLVQKLYWILSSVDTVNTPGVGATSSALSVNKLSFLDNPLVVDLAGVQVRLTSGGGAAVVLTNSFAPTSNLTFQNLDFSGQTAIRVTADLAAKFATTGLDITIILK